MLCKDLTIPKENMTEEQEKRTR